MEVLIQSQEIQDIVDRLAQRINKDYEGKELVAIGILKGSVFFLTDLLRKIDIPIELDFIEVSSYDGVKSRGTICIKKDISIDIKDKDVLVIEDIFSTGTTANELKKFLLSRNPKSLKFAVFLDQPQKRKVEIEAEYIGKAIPDGFVVGYGQDYNGSYRNLPEVMIFKDSQTL